MASRVNDASALGVQGEPSAPAGAPAPQQDVALSADDVCVPIEDDDTVRCIFCLDPASDEERVNKSPCLCTGTLMALHKTCLKVDLMKNLRLSCSICHFPFSYEVSLEPHNFYSRLKTFFTSRRVQIMYGLGVPICIVLLVTSVFVKLSDPSFNILSTVIIGGAIFFVLGLYLGIGVNDLPVHTVHVRLLSPTAEERDEFKRAPIEALKRRRQQEKLGSIGAEIKKGRLKPRPEQQVVNFDFPITIQMIHDQEQPPVLKALINRSNEEAKRIQEEEAAAARRAEAASAEAADAATTSTTSAANTPRDTIEMTPADERAARGAAAAEEGTAGGVPPS